MKKREYSYLLSICIPTYNRVDTLTKCIDSIVLNDFFSENIEIVISDNCSSDNTEAAVQTYLKKYKSVKYYRNSSNLGGDRNILLSLQRGNGKYLKLTNDYNVFSELGIKHLIDIVEKYSENEPALFFNSNSKIEYHEDTFHSFDKFVEKAGWTMSWIGNHGFWKSDIDSWEKDADRYIAIKFMQVDWLIRSFFKRNEGIICTTNLTYRLDTIAKQGDYNFFEIHTDNYFYLFQECVKDGRLSEKSFLVLKRKVLRGLLQWVFTLYLKRDNRYSFSYRDGIHHLFYNYKGFYWAYIELAISIPVFIAKQIRELYRKLLLSDKK